jgi:anti-sigma-K factor RskA
MNNSSLFELLPAYALGALSEEERAQVEAFLASSEEARAELRAYEAMLTGMATLVPARKAPPNLTEDFRKRLAASAVPPAMVKPSAPTRRQWQRRPALLLGLTALIVVVIGAVLIYRSVVIDSETRAIQTILGNSAAVHVKLDAQSGATGNVSFVILPDSKLGVLVAELPTLQEEKQYQLWLLKTEEKESGAVFSVTGPARQVLVTMPDVPSEYQAVGITVEPKGGSPGPTTSPIFVGKLTQSE